MPKLFAVIERFRSRPIGLFTSLHEVVEAIDNEGSYETSLTDGEPSLDPGCTSVVVVSKIILDDYIVKVVEV